MTPTFIASDVEGTLTTGETWKGMARWMQRNSRAEQYQRFFNRNLPAAILARLGLINKREFQNRFMEGAAGLLAGLSRTQIEQVGVWVAEHELWPQRRQDVVAELQAALKQGEQVVVCSATFQPVLEAFATKLGTGVIALGTPLEIRGEVFTGRIIGSVRAGQAKAQQLREFLQDRPLRAAYGDSLSDQAMLELAQNPVAVYPEGKLKALALAKGWRIIE